MNFPRRWVVGRVLLMAAAFVQPVAAQEVLQGREALQPGAVTNPYAVLIGENPGGVGQTTLHYAEADAQPMAAVLRELGKFSEARTHVLLGPDRAQLVATLAAVGDELQAARARGEQAQLVFYYSGHARADAIHLGSEELALGELLAGVCR